MRMVARPCGAGQEKRRAFDLELRDLHWCGHLIFGKAGHHFVAVGQVRNSSGDDGSSFFDIIRNDALISVEIRMVRQGAALDRVLLQTYARKSGVVEGGVLSGCVELRVDKRLRAGLDW